MSEKTVVFKSILGELIAGYIEEKRAVGYKYIKSASRLKEFDALAAKEHLPEKKLPKELVLLWTGKRPNEMASTRNGRISIVRGFAKYMVRLGYEAYIFPAAAVAINRYSYVPYIFSKEELKSMFIICDNYPVSNVTPIRHLILPLLFRILYGCGLRISEAVTLKINDVDLKRGVLFIRNTKFGKERTVPMAKSLTERCRLYANQVHNLKLAIHSFSPLRTEDIIRKALFMNCSERYFGRPGFPTVERDQGSTMFVIHFPFIA